MIVAQFEFTNDTEVVQMINFVMYVLTEVKKLPQKGFSNFQY